MKGKILMVLLASVLALTSCKKRNFTDKGPTDVRIHNQTGQVVSEVTVTVTDDPAYSIRSHNYGTLAAGAYSEYFRFDIAYNEADITVKIDDVIYSTPATQFKYLPYIGPDRITYSITIVDAVNRILDIETIIEEPIDDL